MNVAQSLKVAILTTLLVFAMLVIMPNLFIQKKKDRFQKEFNSVQMIRHYNLDDCASKIKFDVLLNEKFIKFTARPLAFYFRRKATKSLLFIDFSMSIHDYE